MAAITKRLLHLRSNFHSNARPHPYPLHHFSSLSDADADADPHIAQTDLNSEGQISPPLSSSFSSIKDSLQEQPPSQNRDRIPRTPSPSRASSTDSIHRYLSEFRIRSAAPPPSNTGEYFSLQELYERNLNSKVDNSAKSSSTYSGGVRSFDPIRDSLRQLNPNARNDSGGKLSDRWSSSGIAENLKLKGDSNANKYLKTFVGGGDSFMMSFLRGKGDYHQDLGKNLKMLRPQNRKGKWFSLQELSDRLSKLREAQKKERNMISSIRGGIAGTAQQKESKLPLKNLGFLVGGTESYELLPPKKELVEKFFHPDNLSSAEKLKLELKKVRDEFKMSESDCGSARVQVAQLTLKIKHLSNVLQKKDKHSRKGLQAMVQRRKKLLKYLRRTDWDSYCLVLSKLGLRDNPDIKA